MQAGETKAQLQKSFFMHPLKWTYKPHTNTSAALQVASATDALLVQPASTTDVLLLYIMCKLIPLKRMEKIQSGSSIGCSAPRAWLHDFQLAILCFTVTRCALYSKTSCDCFSSYCCIQPAPSWEDGSALLCFVLVTTCRILYFVSGFEKRGNFVHFPKFQL